MKTITLGPKGKRYKIYDPGGGGNVAKTLRTGKPYEVDVLEDMASLGLSGVGVDAGANIGNHTLWMAVVMGLTVHAFEPVRYGQLVANLALNNVLNRVNTYSFALGASNSVGTITGPGKQRSGATISTLDSYGFHDVSLLKVDVEGMDADVIEGGLATIEANRPVIYAEAWDDDYRSRIDALLKPLGYRHAKAFRWNQNKWVPS